MFFPAVEMISAASRAMSAFCSIGITAWFGYFL
jgi:hypothetical protein